MTLRRAKATLRKIQKMAPGVQRGHRAHLVEAFKVFWLSGPSREEFSERLHHVVLFPEMLYDLAFSKPVHPPQKGH